MQGHTQGHTQDHTQGPAEVSSALEAPSSVARVPAVPKKRRRSPVGASAAALGVGSGLAVPAVCRYTGVMSAPLLRTLQAAFAVGSPFWPETGYSTSGSYYSFWIDTAARPAHAIALLAAQLRPLAGM